MRTILVIDDSDDDVFFMKRALKQAGIPSSLIHLSGGQEAIDYLGRTGLFSNPDHRPAVDIIFLDVNMPRVSGFDVLSWVQSHEVCPTPFIVVMLTSSSEARDRDRAMRLGAHSYALKPPTPTFFAELSANYSITWLPSEPEKSASPG